MANLDTIIDPTVIKVSSVALTSYALLGEVSSVYTLDASDTISSSYNIALIQGNGDVTMTSTPTISAGLYNGQELTLIGQNDSAYVELQDESVLGNTTLRHAGARILSVEKMILYAIFGYHRKANG